MKAKKMKSNAKLTVNGNDGYYFRPTQMDAFTAQLLLEQRELCADNAETIRELSDIWIDKDSILTAPAPDGFEEQKKGGK